MVLTQQRFNDYLQFIDEKLEGKQQKTPINFFKKLNEHTHLLKIEIQENLVLIIPLNKSHYKERILLDIMRRFDKSFDKDLIIEYLKRYEISLENLDDTFLHHDNNLVRFLNSYPDQNIFGINPIIYDLKQEELNDLEDEHFFINLEYKDFSNAQNLFVRYWINESLSEIKDFLLDTNIVEDKDSTEQLSTLKYSFNNANRILLLRYLEELNILSLSKIHQDKTKQAKTLSAIMNASPQKIREILGKDFLELKTEGNLNSVYRIANDLKAVLPELIILVERDFRAFNFKIPKL